jgi:hypothetical protein
MRLRHLVTALVLASSLPFAACSSGGDKCDTCSADSDCSSSKGYVCERYVDGRSRCGDPSRPFDTCPTN